jgi:hypothetical protein
MIFRKPGQASTAVQTKLTELYTLRNIMAANDFHNFFMHLTAKTAKIPNDYHQMDRLQSFRGSCTMTQ